mmetsp:Transcript_37322/g.78719  ORF Transcript_37322/g.78719 Transcript_37322/m.78719 type:complete len:118 (+) Transcript_37322:938-1291(+)
MIYKMIMVDMHDDEPTISSVLESIQLLITNNTSRCSKIESITRVQLSLSLSIHLNMHHQDVPSHPLVNPTKSAKSDNKCAPPFSSTFPFRPRLEGDCHRRCSPHMAIGGWVDRRTRL